MDDREKRVDAREQRADEQEQRADAQGLQAEKREQRADARHEQEVSRERAREQRNFKAILISAGLVTAFAVLAITAAILYENKEEKREKARDLATRIEARRITCREIEKLKRDERLEAWRGWNTLDDTLTLLKLERTENIVTRARLDRDRNLTRFAPLDCEVFARETRIVFIAADPAERKEGLP